MPPRSLADVRRVVSFVALAALTFSAEPTRAQSPSVPPSQSALLEAPSAPRVVTLPNGLRVAIIEDRAAPVVQTAVWYRFGAADERPGKTGLAHALEHMMYRGTPWLSGSGLDDIATQLGAQETATTGNDYTVFRFVVPSDALEVALRIEADRMQHLDLRETTWQNERANLIAEHDAILDQPLTKLYTRVCAAATSARVCALAPLGERSDLATATSADLRGYYQQFYAPNNATLVIAGDVSGDAALALVETIFGKIPTIEQDPRLPSQPFYMADRNVEISGDFPYDVVDLAYAAPGSADPDAAALTIVDSVINNARSDFHKALVRSGYTLGYSTQLDQNAHAGLYHVFLIVAPGHSSEQARNAFVDVLASAVAGGFPADLVAAAKLGALRSATYARDSVAELGDRAGFALAVNGDADATGATTRVEAASTAEIALVLRRYLRSPAVTGLLTPSAARRGIALAPPATIVSDDFSRRTPTGKLVESRLIRNAMPSSTAPAERRVVASAFSLPNGLRAIVSPIHANPTISFSGSVETSPAFDPPAKIGLGAFVASLVSEGSVRYDFDAQRKIVDDTGATLELGTTFSGRSRARDFDALLDVVAESLRHPAFSRDAIERVTAQTIAAIDRRDGDPAFRAGHEFEALLASRDDPSLREPTRATIGAIAPGDLRAYARAYLRPDLVTIAIAGDIDDATARAKIAAHFGSWTAAGPRPDPRPAPYARPARASRYVVSDRRDIEARVGQSLAGRSSADYDALALIGELLGGDGNFDTRLMHRLHVEKPIVDSISAALDADRYRGSLVIRFEAPPRNLTAAVAGIRYEFDRLKGDPVGPFELARARSKLVARALLAEQSTQNIAARVQRAASDGRPPDDDATLVARYAAIDGATIMRVARAYLHPESLSEVYEGPRP